MSPSAARMKALTVVCLAGTAASCAPQHRTAMCARPETVAVEYSEQICFAGPEGYEACEWRPRTHVVTVPAVCEPATTVREEPLVAR